MNKKKTTPKTKKILKFVPKKESKKVNPDGIVIEEGKLGELSYTVYKRGVIHLAEKSGKLLFKKDCELFEAEVDKMNLNDLKDGDVEKMEGSGDNDNLVFTCVKGDIVMSLESREYGLLTKLKGILKKGAKK